MSLIESARPIEPYRAPPSSAAYARAIQHEVAQSYGLTRDDLLGPRRVARHALARHIAIYLTRTLVPLGKKSNAWIGWQFGGRSYSTIINSVSHTRRMLDAAPAFAEQVRALRDRLSAGE